MAKLDVVYLVYLHGMENSRYCKFSMCPHKKKLYSMLNRKSHENQPLAVYYFKPGGFSWGPGENPSAIPPRAMKPYYLPLNTIQCHTICHRDKLTLSETPHLGHMSHREACVDQPCMDGRCYWNAVIPVSIFPSMWSDVVARLLSRSLI